MYKILSLSGLLLIFSKIVFFVSSIKIIQHLHFEVCKIKDEDFILISTIYLIMKKQTYKIYQPIMYELVL